MKIAIIAGPRCLSGADEKIVRDVVRELLAKNFRIYVGDAVGVDAIALSETMQTTHSSRSYRVFNPIAALGRTPAGLAERSTRMVKEAIRDAGEDEIVAVGFPNRSCPAGIMPARTWRSGSSGTWSTIAIALGCGIETWIVPLGLERFSFPWGLWENNYTLSTVASYRFKQLHGDLFYSHDVLANGWTEFANLQGDPSES